MHNVTKMAFEFSMWRQKNTNAKTFVFVTSDSITSDSVLN